MHCNSLQATCEGPTPFASHPNADANPEMKSSLPLSPENDGAFGPDESHLLTDRVGLAHVSQFYIPETQPTAGAFKRGP